MFEPSLSHASLTAHSTLSDSTFHQVKSTGLRKIVSFGYGHNQIQSLPMSRYSLKVSLLGIDPMSSVVAIAFAALGHKVVAVDDDQRKVNSINQSRICSKDVKLHPLLKEVRRINNLVATGDLHNSILNSDLTLFCTPRRQLKEGARFPTKLAKIYQSVGVSLKHKALFHTLVICPAAHEEVNKEHIVQYLEESSGKTLGVDFGLCIVPIALDHKQPLSDLFSIPVLHIASSDKDSASKVEKLFDGFSLKVRHTSLG